MAPVNRPHPPAKREVPVAHRAVARSLQALLMAVALAPLAVVFAADERWDVVVVGSEPEAIAAAVAASEEGARTLLVTSASRLGGLFVQGELNMLDLRVTPFDFQLGVFDRWWRATGRHNSFDVQRAERAFAQLLQQAGVTVRLGQTSVTPWLHEANPERVIGVQLGGMKVAAEQVIDGTGDAEFAALAGARSSFGFESLGWPVRMADTLVFRIQGVDWTALRRGVGQRGRDYAYADERVAYGHFGGVPAAYQPSQPLLRLRGLNLGRQDDGTVLVNALLIYGLDPFDPDSLREGYERAAREVPRIIEYLSSQIPGFARARSAGFAETLYVRQTRHLQSLCQLTIDDVLDGWVTDLDIAIGGYPLDVQTLRPSDTGFVFGMPDIYGGRLCMMKPDNLQGVWVVGRSAGYDPLAQSSARVVPFGMAMAEAAGVAAAHAVREGMASNQAALDPEAIAHVRARLMDRGAVLAPARQRQPVGPVGHPHYADYRTLLRWGLAVGGYDNDPRLDAVVARVGLHNLLANVEQRALGGDRVGRIVFARHGVDTQPLLPEQASAAIGTFLHGLGDADAQGWGDANGPQAQWRDLQALGLTLENPGREIRRGELYALAVWILERFDRRDP
jgi:hypothetical protein